MKQEELVVRCTYEETSQTVEQVFRSSFRLFLQKELDLLANVPEYQVSSS